MAPLTPVYPAALDDLTTLGRVSNFAETTVGTGGVDASAATIPITDTTAWPSDGACVIEAEAVSYTGKTGSSITGCSRGFDGTTAASHAAGAAAYGGAIISAHYEALRDALLSVEALLGIQGFNTYKPEYAKVLSANGSNTATTISPFFATLPGIPIVAGEEYELTAFMNFLKNTAGTLVWTLTFSAAPTFVNAELDVDPVAGAALGAAQVLTAPLRSIITGGTSAATAFPATASITTATYHQHRLHAIFTAGATGNVRINVTNSAGTVTPLRGSRYELVRLVDVGTTVA